MMFSNKYLQLLCREIIEYSLYRRLILHIFPVTKSKISTRWRHQTVITARKIKVNNFHQKAVKNIYPCVSTKRDPLPSGIKFTSKTERWKFQNIKSTICIYAVFCIYFHILKIIIFLFLLFVYYNKKGLITSTLFS